MKFRKGEVVFVSVDVHAVYKFIAPYIPETTMTNYSTQTAGYRSTQTAGYDSTQTAGYDSTQTAGDGSTQTAGYDSTQTAGDYSFHCLRGSLHVLRPSRYSLISII